MAGRAPRTVDRPAAPAPRRPGALRRLRRNRWLLARRAAQLALLAAFASGPWWGVPVAAGTLAASRWFGVLDLADPFVALQSLLAGHALAAPAIGGAVVLALFYAVTAGRLYCGWICPVNLVTDAAAGLRRALGLRRHHAPLRTDRRLRQVVLLLVLVGSAATGTIVWEVVNPITWASRAVSFGLWPGAAVALGAVFVLDLLVLERGWCAHLCPVGAAYGWLGRFSARLGVRAARAEACTRCGDCFAVCPEPQVIAPVLRPGDVARVIADADCLRCGRCIDRCDEDVFVIGWGAAGAARSRSRG
jgi:ferredoxin-type protein NapH